MNTAETIEYKNHTIEICYDESAPNPRKDWDPFGSLVCWHRRYSLGDKHSFDSPKEMFEDIAGIYLNDLEWKDFRFSLEDGKRLTENSVPVYGTYRWETRYKLGGRWRTEEEAREIIERKAHEKAVILPVYLYDHSGLTINTTGFSCGWDSGQIGYIYATRKQILDNFLEKRLTKKLRQKAEDLLRAEVETYDQYLRGECYGYVITDETGEETDSCWGFLGDIDYCIEEAKGVVDYSN